VAIAWYFNSATPEHLRYLRGMTRADMFEQLAQSRERILATPGVDPQSDWPDEEARQFIRKIADNHDKGEGGRAQLEFFKNDTTIRWSFASPPWFMRPWAAARHLSPDNRHIAVGRRQAGRVFPWRTWHWPSQKKPSRRNSFISTGAPRAI
jgi:hypothetical protein